MTLKYISLHFFYIVSTVTTFLFLTFRTKTTAIVKEALAPLSKEHVIASLRNSPYCFATDGSSDEDEKLFPLMFR